MGALHVIPGEFSTFTIAIAILSGFIVFFGYVSMFIKERCFLSEACKGRIFSLKMASTNMPPYSSRRFNCRHHCRSISVKWV